VNVSLPIVGLINSGKEPKMKHKIGIVWGECPANSDYELKQYSFNTKVELDAFILGINAMDGWHGYHVIGKNGDFATLTDLKEYYSYVEELEG
tara:strand:+ start:21462 stop:21740 length:279 start_codon:yes stop_codon:yes gene_type:complete